MTISRRVNHGRGHSYYIDDQKIPGVTTVLGDGYPKPQLVNWAADESAKYVLNHWDELVELPPGERYTHVRDARFKTQKEAAVRGTTVHEYAHRLSSGEELTVPDELVGHVDSYLKFSDDWQPKEIFVERPVFSRTFGYAGTPDLIAQLRDGHTWLLDWKTSEKGPFLDNVLQLAALRYADYALDDNDTEQPLPRIDRTGIIQLRADGYDLYPVEAGAEAFEIFGAVQRIAAYVKSGNDNWIGDAIRPPSSHDEEAA